MKTRCGFLNRVIVLILSALIPFRLMGDPGGEYEVKSALVFNFLKFAEFAEHAGSGQITLCLISPTAEAAAPFTHLNGQFIGSRALDIRLVQVWQLPDRCDVAFFPGDNSGNALEGLARLRGNGTLTIGEMPGFAAAGGIIGLFEEGQRVRFEINPDNAAVERIRLSSRLLSLARIARN